MEKTMKKLFSDRIIKMEEQPLSEEDMALLTVKKNQQLKFVVISYIPLALILLIVFLNGPSPLHRDRFPYQTHEVTDEDESNFKLVAPYVCGFFFLILTAYFINFFLQSVAPLMKDIKRKEKLLATVATDKIDMGLLNKYYISTPVKRIRQVSIDRNEFEKLSAQTPTTFEIAPNSGEILGIYHNNCRILIS